MSTSAEGPKGKPKLDVWSKSNEVILLMRDPYLTVDDVAEHFGCGRDTIYRILATIPAEVKALIPQRMRRPRKRPQESAA